MKQFTVLFSGLLITMSVLLILLYNIHGRETRFLYHKINQLFTVVLDEDFNCRLKQTGMQVTVHLALGGESTGENSDDYTEFTHGNTTEIIKKQEGLSMEQRNFNALQTILLLENPVDIDDFNSRFQDALVAENITVPTAIRYKANGKPEENTADLQFYPKAFATDTIWMGTKNEMQIQGFAYLSPLFLLSRNKITYILLTAGWLLLVAVTFIVFRNRRRKESSEPVMVTYMLPDISVMQAPDLSPSILKIADNISFDTEKRVLFYKDREIKLTKQKADLLALFLKAPDNFLTNDAIVAGLWGNIYDSVGCRVKAIKRLREDLATIEALTIDNIRGEGYQLKVSLPQELDWLNNN